MLMVLKMHKYVFCLCPTETGGLPETAGPLFPQAEREPHDLGVQG